MNLIPLLNPALLVFLPVAAIPVLLHLLTRHRVKTVELATYRFLFDTYVQQRRRMRFLEALIALLRTLFLALLVFMLARPALRHWDRLLGAGGNREVLLLVDSSESMNTTTAGRSALDRARGVAQTIADRLGPEDRLTLFRLGARPEEVFSRFAGDTQAIRNSLDGLQAGSSRANLLAAFSQIFGRQAPPREQPLVYLLTDGQASGWTELQQQGAAGLLPPDATLQVIFCGSATPLSNRAVIGDTPRQARSIVGLPVKLVPRVANHSATEAAEVQISVQINRKEIARPVVPLKPGETTHRELVYLPTEPGVFEGRFHLERPEGGLPDGFPADDDYLFTLEVTEPLPVLLVNGAPHNDPLESETLFLKTALTAPDEREPIALPAGTPQPAPGPLATPDARSLTLQEIGEGQLNEEILKSAQVVILANCGQLNGNQYTFLRNFTTRGGGLLIFPGDKVNPDQYRQQFFINPQVPDRRFVPLDLAPPQGDLADANAALRLAAESLDFAHPILSVFDTPQSRYLTSARFFRRFPLVPPTQRPDLPANAPTPALTDKSYWPLASFSDGSPALIEMWPGEGKLLLAAFPASGKWSNLPLKPEFVPLVLRMVQHVAHRPGLEFPSVVPPGTPAEIRVAKSWEPITGQVRDPAGQRSSLQFRPTGSRSIAAVEQTGLKGFYEAEIRGGTGDDVKQGTARFAVNLAPEESDFTRIEESAVRDLFPGTAVEFVDATAEAQQQYGSVGGDSREIWRPLILLMLAVMGLEFWLATLGGGRDDASQTTLRERLGALNPARWVGAMTGSQIPPDPQTQ